MKKKIIFAVATGLFALATVFNMNVLQSNNAGDVSLESIAVMAQAQHGESNMLPEVTVYGCSSWSEAYDPDTGYYISCCLRWTSSAPCSNEC